MSNYKANEPYVLVSEDTHTISMKPLFEVMKGDSTYETIPDLVHESSYADGVYTLGDDIISLHAGFDVADSWADGEIKQFYFRGLCRPIKLNGSNTFDSTTFNKVIGKVIISIEDESSLFYMASNSYIDNHVVSNETSISKEIRSYTLVLEVKRIAAKLWVTGIKYTMPYFHEDSVAGIYSQGEFTFRSFGSLYPSSTSDNNSTGMQLKYGTPFSNNDISKVTITIGTDWMPLTEIGSCNNWIALFTPTTEGNKMYLSVKPYDITTVV